MKKILFVLLVLAIGFLSIAFNDIYIPWNIDPNHAGYIIPRAGYKIRDLTSITDLKSGAYIDTVEEQGRYTALFSPIAGSSSITSIGAATATGKVTFNQAGNNYALHAIAAGDSVFLHTIVDASDTTLKTWSGTSWKTIIKLK